MAQIDRILQRADAMGATDLHLRTGQLPRIRKNGDLIEVENAPTLSGADVEQFAAELMTDEQRDHLVTHSELEFTYDGPFGRYRVFCGTDHRGPGAVFRRLPPRILRLADLGMSRVEQFAHTRRGLLLITGAPGSGTTTTLAALLNVINERYHKHVITLENTIEYVHTDRLGVFHQRQLHVDFDTYADGIRAAMGQDPDVLVIDRLAGEASIRAALDAADSGIFVIARFDTNGAVGAIDELLRTFPEPSAAQMRVQLADCLAGVLYQALLRRESGAGRVPASEVLVSSPAVAALIRAGRTAEIDNVIQGGGGQGMHTIDDSLFDLLQANKISAEDAWARACNKSRFESVH